MASKNPGIVLPSFDGLKRDLPQRGPERPAVAVDQTATAPVSRRDRAAHPLLARARRETTEQLNTRVPVRLIERMRRLKADCGLDQTAIVVFALEKILPELEAAKTAGEPERIKDEV